MNQPIIYILIQMTLYTLCNTNIGGVSLVRRITLRKIIPDSKTCTSGFMYETNNIGRVGSKINEHYPCAKNVIQSSIYYIYKYS